MMSPPNGRGRLSGEQAASNTNGRASGLDVDSTQDRSPLRQALDNAIAESNGSRLSMKDLTVLTNDPFRLDTPQNHKIGEWLAETASTLGLGNRKIHNRGLHYMILGQPKPDGSTYVSDEASWNLLE
jgi:hypothetical protein